MTDTIGAVARWLLSGEVGSSSKAIAGKLTGLCVSETDEPCDPSDLRRCRLLLEQVPALMPIFHRMKDVSEEWAAMVEAWGELCALMDEEAPEWRMGRCAAPKTYARMLGLRGCA